MASRIASGRWEGWTSTGHMRSRGEPSWSESNERGHNHGLGRGYDNYTPKVNEHCHTLVSITFPLCYLDYGSPFGRHTHCRQALRSLERVCHNGFMGQSSWCKVEWAFGTQDVKGGLGGGIRDWESWFLEKGDHGCEYCRSLSVKAGG